MVNKAVILAILVILVKVQGRGAQFPQGISIMSMTNVQLLTLPPTSVSFQWLGVVLLVQGVTECHQMTLNDAKSA